MKTFLCLLFFSLAALGSDYVDSAAVIGMVGDDTTDNSAAFQLALTQAKAHKSRTLYIRAGKYKFGTAPVVPTNITIIGEGNLGDAGGYDQTGEPSSVQLKFTGNAGPALHLPTCSSNRIENLCIDGISGRDTTGICVGNEMYLNATTTTGSPIVTVQREGGFPLAVGQRVRAPGIPADTFITAIGPGQFTMDKNATTTFTHRVKSLAVSHPDYENGYNYPGFAGNHLTLTRVMVRNFRVGLFAHYLGGVQSTDCTFANNKVGIWIDTAIHPAFRGAWIGGSDYGLNDVIGVRGVGNSDGIIMEGVEFWLCAKCVEAEACNVTLRHFNCEQVTGPFFDGTLGSYFDLTTGRVQMARNPAAIPVRVNEGAATLNAVTMEGSSHYVVCECNYPQDVSVGQFARIYQIRQIDSSGNQVAVFPAGISASNVTHGTLPESVTP